MRLDIMKILSLQVSKKFIRDSDLTPSQASDFVKGRSISARYGDTKES